MDSTASFDLSSLVGKVVDGTYPRHNIRGVRSNLEHRRVLVERVQDVERQPLDPLTVVLNPLVNRGRFLIVGRDLEKDADRQFYLDRFAEFRIVEREECERARPNEEAAVVAIVEVPADWKPETADDVPPNVERRTMPKPHLAAAFSRLFNERELRESTGRWAVR